MSDRFDNSPERYVCIWKCWEKRSFLFIRKQKLAIFCYLKKIGFTLTCHHFRSTLGLDSGQGSQLTTNTKKSLILALRGKCLGEKCI